MRFYQRLNRGTADYLWNHFRAGCPSFSPQVYPWDHTFNPKAVGTFWDLCWEHKFWWQSHGSISLLWKRLGDDKLSLRKVLSQPLLLRCNLSKPGESIHWETCSFPLCKDTLILFLTIPLNSNSKVNAFLGCPIGSPQTSFQFRFPHHSADSLVNQSGNLDSQIP